MPSLARSLSFSPRGIVLGPLKGQPNLELSTRVQGMEISPKALGIPPPCSLKLPPEIESVPPLRTPGCHLPRPLRCTRPPWREQGSSRWGSGHRRGHSLAAGSELPCPIIPSALSTVARATLSGQRPRPPLLCSAGRGLLTLGQGRLGPPLLPPSLPGAPPNCHTAPSPPPGDPSGHGRTLVAGREERDSVLACTPGRTWSAPCCCGAT